MPLSALGILNVGRWILIALLSLTLFSVGRALVKNELALPVLRAEAAEGLREDASAGDLYAQALDSLGVRLALRQSLSEEAQPDSARVAALTAEIEMWQTRMGHIIRYRALSERIPRFRRYSWVAMGLLSLMLAALVLAPRWRSALRKA